ncbi:hypothetical protein G7046_g4375 [Stylonectria norvegica]|nr:hypothetical protein G7046_g4375 [Stylonectria norvegica]
MNTPSTNKVKKPIKRDVVARREQNRIASRNYREKQRQKLALLDHLLDSDDAQLSEPPKSDEGRAELSRVETRRESLTGHGEAPVVEVSAVQELGNDAIAPQVANPVDVFIDNDTWGDLPDAATVSLSTDTSNGLVPFASPSTMFEPSHFDNWNSMALEISPSTLQFPEYAPNSRSISSPAQHTEPVSERDGPLLEVLQGVENLTLHQKRALLRHLQHETQYPRAAASPPRAQGHSIPNPSPTSLQLQAQAFANTIHREASGWNCLPSSPNYCLTQTGFFAALFANCLALGMGSIEPLIADEGWSVFSLAPELAYHPSQLSVVRSKFRNIAPDLRPSDMQLTVAHHPYIDVLPFKTFRNNLIRVLYSVPQLVDEDELCHDLSTGGVLCWGAQQGSFGMDAVVPWDKRSWEPKVWFLEKYSHLVGGKDDEMWKSAMWWQRRRGERIHEV